MTATPTLLTTDSSTANASSYTTASITPTSGRVVFVGVFITGTNPAPAVTVTGCGATWERVDGTPAAARTATVYRASGTFTPGPLTFTTASGITSCSWVVVEFDGADTTGTNGSAAIGQSFASRPNGTSVSEAFPAPPAATSGGFAVVGTAVQESPTAGTGWTGTGLNQSGPVTGFIGLRAASCPSAVAASWTTSANAFVVGVEVKPAASPNSGSATGTWRFTGTATGGSPLTAGQILNIGPAANQNHFAVQIAPDGGSAIETHTQAEIAAGYTDPIHFHTTPDGWVRFQPRADGPTTSGTTYARDELREVDAAGVNYKFDALNGEHTLTTRFRINHVPANDPDVVVMQLHNGDADRVAVRTQGFSNGTTVLGVRFNGTLHATRLQTPFVAATEQLVKIRVFNAGAVEIYYNDMTTPVITMPTGTLVQTTNPDGWYWKTGAYNQFNPVDTGATGLTVSATEYSQVDHKDLAVTHPAAAPTSNGAAAGGWQFTGTATGVTPRTGSARGFVAWTGTAEGPTTVFPLIGPVAAAFVTDGVAAAGFATDGRFTGAFVNDGTAAGSFTRDGIYAAQFAGMVATARPASPDARVGVAIVGVSTVG